MSQVMEEGEVLASKQAELELSIKKLKQQVRWRVIIFYLVLRVYWKVG
jgi:hypothetical protein